MNDRPLRTLPEEIMLACADPATGVIRRPDFFNRALSGAVLAELELRGAIVFQDDRITEVRPLTLGEPLIDALLGQLVSDVRMGRSGDGPIRLSGGLAENLPRALHTLPDGFLKRAGAAIRLGINACMPQWPLSVWMVGWPPFGDIEQRCLEAMEARGLLVAHRRKMLGVIPRLSWHVASPELTRENRSAIDDALRARAPGVPSGSPSRRALRLAALVGAADLGTRLYPGSRHREARRRMKALTAQDPIAAAADDLREQDLRSRMRPD